MAKRGKVPPPRASFCGPLSGSRFLRPPFFFFFFFFFFLLATFFAAPWRIFAAPIIFFVRRPSLSRTILCSYIIFCPSTVVKLDINFPILSTNLQNAAPQGCRPPASGVCGAGCYATVDRAGLQGDSYPRLSEDEEWVGRRSF